MKRSCFVLSAVCLVLAGCSSVSVNRDYDVSVDFGQLKTYAWQHAEQPQTGNPRIDNDLIDERVRSAVEAQLNAKGFVRVDKADADFLVAYFIDYKQRISGSSISFGMGAGSYGRYGGVGYDTGISDYEEGHLTIDVITPADEKNIWRGVGRRRAYESNNPEKVTKVINKAVAAILKKFPPKK
jgi:hypothetical protein